MFISAEKVNAIFTVCTKDMWASNIMAIILDCDFREAEVGAKTWMRLYNERFNFLKNNLSRVHQMDDIQTLMKVLERNSPEDLKSMIDVIVGLKNV